MRGPASAVLFGCISILLPLVTTAGELPDRTRARGDSAAQLNRQQLSRTSEEPIATPAKSNGGGEQVGVLFLRGDGGDPKEVRVGEDTLVLVTTRDGSSRVYQNGRPIDVQPAIQESASQIAVGLFRSTEGAQVPLSELPMPARKDLSQLTETGVKPQVMFARIVTREDTAKVSDIRASKILMLDSSARAASRTDIVDLVRTAMRTLGLKSDVCDSSEDSRCNYPGVREAFQMIKREEALQRRAEQR